MARLKAWLFQIIVALDQLCTALVGGFADETLSSYAYRMEMQRKPWGVARRWIDAVFDAFGDYEHCQGAYRSERKRAQMPPELR